MPRGGGRRDAREAHCGGMKWEGSIRSKGFERNDLAATVDRKRLLKLCVFGFGLPQNGNVGVGAFPEVKEVFVGGEGTDASGVSIRALRRSRLKRIGTGDAQMG